MKKHSARLFCAICATSFLTTAATAVRINIGDGGDLNVSVLASDRHRIALEFTVGGFDKTDVTINGRIFSRISLPGEGVSLEPGLPELPLVARSVIIPDDRDIRLRVVTAEYADLAGIDVVPSKGNLLRTVNPDDVPFAFGPYRPKTTSRTPAHIVDACRRRLRSCNHA